LELDISQLEGVGPVTVKKLKEFGVTSLFDICVRGSREISEITATAKTKADVWVFNAQKILEDEGLIRKTDMTTLELFDYQKNIDTLPVKCEAVDNLMSGGVKPECTYEVYGEFGSGKTQFCLALTAEAIARGDNVVWVDCEDTFRPNRVKEILIERGHVQDMDEAMKYMERIDYFLTPNTEQLMGTINALSDVLLAKKPRLVVIDGSFANKTSDNALIVPISCSVLGVRK
jgi:DNA repair protein RadA